jgi:hypothetical protein
MRCIIEKIIIVRGAHGMRTTPLKVISAVILALFLSIITVRTPVSAFPFSTVYITRPGTQYHRNKCIALRHSKIAIKLSDAKSMGFSPCKRCTPPTW